MKGFDVLDPDFKIQGKIFLEAAAGCGKTFAIEHIVARLLIEEGILFEECLIVTFTKAAAIDLKKRIFETLNKIEKAVLSRDFLFQNYPYLASIQNHEEVLFTVQRAIESINQAMISTIHGFCYQFLHQNAYFVDLPIGHDEELSMLDLIKDALRGLSKEKFPSCWLFQFQDPLNSLDESIAKTLLPYLGYPFNFDDKVEFEVLYQKFIELVLERKKTFKTVKEKIESIGFSYFNGLVAKDKTFKFAQEWSLFEEILEANLITKGHFEKFLELKDFFLLLQEKKLAKKVEKEPSIKAICLEMIDYLTPFLSLIEKTLDRSNIALNLIFEMQGRLKEALKTNPLIHPDFLLKQMKEMVHKKEVKTLLQNKYRAILIDEFQDTDPIQWDIFQKGFFDSDHLHLFVCVGDPKQSIYGFRNADLSTYLKAKELFTEKNCYVLDTNYRSEKKLIQALNELFLADKDVGFFQFDPYPLKIDYFPIKAKYDFLWKPTDNKAGLHYLFIEKDKIKSMEEELLFPYLAKECMALIDQGIQIDKIAFLVKDRYQGQRLKEFLEKKGFELEALKTDLLIEKDSYHLILWMLEFLAHPESKNAFRKILYHPYVRQKQFFDLTFIETGLLSFKASWHENLKQHLSYEAFPSILHHLFSSFSISENLLESKNFQAYEELVQFKEYLFDLWSTKQSFEQMYQIVYQLQNKDSSELQNLKKRSVKSNKMPTIITMHSSKGLEYDIVFILGLYSESHQEPLFYKQAEDDEKRWGLKNPCQADLHRIENDLEKARQFYVAATRAKKRIYFPVLIEKNSTYANKKELSSLLLYLKKAIFNSADYKVIYDQEIDSESIRNFLKSFHYSSFEELTVIEEVFWQSKEEKRDEKIFPPLPFSAPSKKVDVISFSSIKEEKIETKIQSADGVSKGALFGTFFHELVEKTIETRYYEKTESIEFYYWLKKRVELTPYEEDFEEILSYIQKLMKTPLMNHQFPLESLPYQCLMPEMKMQFKINQPLEMKGFLDLLVFFDGKFTIIDFKTNFLGDQKENYTHQRLQQVLIDKEYDLQAACYLEALKKYLDQSFIGDYRKAIASVTFVFIRGLPFNQGVISLNELQQLNQRFEDAIISRT